MAKPDLSERILDAALEIAKAKGWEAVRLHDIADRLGRPLSEVRRLTPDLDGIANVWFARADRAMLAVREEEGFGALPARERLYTVMMGWFDALAADRTATRAMVRYKLLPAHVHLRAGLVIGLSRTVQWIREAAHLDAVGRRKDLEEIGLTALFLATCATWLRDPTPNQERTRRTLKRRLEAADSLMARFFPPS